MKYNFYSLFIAFIIIPLFAFPNQSESNLTVERDMSEKVWGMFEKSQDHQAINLQTYSINAVRNVYKDEVGQEKKLMMLSDLILVQSDSIGSDAIIAKALEIEHEFNRLALTNTRAYYIHSARLGYYYCLAKNFTLADSLTQIAFNNAKLLSFTPEQSLEIHAYRAAYLLSKRYCITFPDYDYINEANKIIDRGLELARVHNIQSCIFYQYLLSLKESIQIDKIKVFLVRLNRDIEAEFKICNNTKSPASFMLKERYNTILNNIQHGKIVESLRFLEPLVQVSVDCRGKSYVASTLYSLISDLYLKLYNFPKAMHYAFMAFDVDKSLGTKAYKDSIFHYNRFSAIKNKYEEYENIKQSDPLNAFENALMSQGPIQEQYARFGMTVESAIDNYLPSDYMKFDFDILINEQARVYGSHYRSSDLDRSNFQIFSNDDINPYIKGKASVTYGLFDETIYKTFRQYSPTLDEAKKIILNKIRTTTDIEEKSLFYHYLAKCHFYEENIDEAIKAQKNHLSIELQLSQNSYTDKVLRAQKTLSLLYMLGMWEALSFHKEEQIERYQNSFIRIGREYMLRVQKYVEKHFSSLNAMDQKALWTPLSNWFFNTIPYMGISNQAAECIYNSALFSKGLLLSASVGKILAHRWQEIRNELNEEDMAIEFVNFRNIHGHEIYYAVTITSNCTYPSIYPLFSDLEYENFNSIDERYYNESQMNDLIIRPIEIQKNIKNIYFSPTGILNTIAIENVIDSVGKRACEKWNMYRLSSTRELLYRSSKGLDVSAESIALIYGDLDYDCSFNQMELKFYEPSAESKDRYRGATRARVSPLEFSKIEIDTIASIALNHKLSTLLMSGSKGTEESLKYYTQAPISILHLSTHGFYYSDEQIAEDRLESDNKYSFLFKDKALESEDLAMTRSALVMSGGNNAMRGMEIPFNRDDGLLTAMEISNLSLKQCDLVSLSACETALGKVSHEGVFGLQRGFKKAGAKCILMSLWEVPDEATCILMQEFYKNIFSGKQKIEALRNAQTLLRSNPNFADPSNWAGWILLDALN